MKPEKDINNMSGKCHYNLTTNNLRTYTHLIASYVFEDFFHLVIIATITIVYYPI